LIEKGDVMILSYKKLWKLLIDKELSKKELANLAGLSQYTINKLNRSETVTTETLLKICYALKCDIGDICHVIFEEE
jgi:DNA-binding Xre family transcriptional regulator